MKSSLESFPCPQVSNKRTLREQSECLDEGVEECVVIDESQIYPTIEIKSENIIKPSISDERVDNIFIRKDITLWKRFFRCIQTNGFVCSLQLIRDYDNEEEIRNNWFLWLSQKISQTILYLWTLLLNLYVFLYPFALKSNKELCNEFNRCKDWSNGLIRAFEWHPNRVKCAVCLINDSIHIYSADNSFVPLLKHSLQSKVTALSWNPSREDILAVSCESTILIWTIDPNSRQYRPSNDCIQIINTCITSPLTDLKYSPNGQYLVGCSPQSSKLMLINTENNSKDVKRVGLFKRFGLTTTCFTKVFWDPNGSRLMTTTTDQNIRVFETKSWSSSKWSLELTEEPVVDRRERVCQTACWSRPKGQILLVAFRDSPSVFAIFFYDSPQPEDVGGTHQCFKVLDFCEHEFPNGVKVGGSVHDLVWDRNSERLAVSFKDNQQFIALFKTVIRPKLEFTPIGFVHGLGYEIPVLISFHDSFKNGSLLTVCWDTGVVSNIPLQFDSKANKSMYMNGTPRSLTSFCVNSPNANNSFISNGTPIRGMPFNKSQVLNSPSIHFTPNDSVLSPKRPQLFSTLTKRNSNYDSID